MRQQPVADPDIAAVHAEIDGYYTAKVTRHGATPLGVDWSCVPTQQLRFLQLLKLCGDERAFLSTISAAAMAHCLSISTNTTPAARSTISGSICRRR